MCLSGEQHPQQRDQQDQQVPRGGGGLAQGEGVGGASQGTGLSGHALGSSASW